MSDCMILFRFNKYSLNAIRKRFGNTHECIDDYRIAYDRADFMLIDCSERLIVLQNAFAYVMLYRIFLEQIKQR